MTHPFTIAKERLRTWIDAAINLRDQLNAVDRATLQGVLNRSFEIVRGGSVTAMAAMEDELRSVVTAYTPTEKEIA